MSTLSRRGPNANTPAKLPGIQTARIGDANTRQAVEALREWVEVRLGSRGDPFERAATMRDLQALLDRVNDLEQSGTVAPSTAGGGPDTTSILNSLSALQQTVTLQLSALTSLTGTLSQDQASTTSRLNSLIAQLETENTALLDSFRAARNEFTAAQTTRQVRSDVTDTGAQMEAYLDGDVSTTFFVLAEEDFELQAPEQAPDGATYTIVVQQDDIGGHRMVFGLGFAFDGVAPAIGQTPGELTLIRATAVSGFVGDELRQVFLTEVFSGFSLTKVKTVASSIGAGAATGRT